tara:strand:- start:339 stop:518 length:180 start_codon:yes stop_codon:yes gene_type:complete
MSNEDQRVRFINTTMSMVNDLSDTLYEALMDEDIASVVETATKLDYVIKDLIQTFSDEI